MAIRTTGPLRVVLLDDSPIVVAGLDALLEPFRHRVCLVPPTATEPEVAVADVMLLDAQEVESRLDRLLGETQAKVLVFGWAADRADRADHVRRGAAGYLSKRAPAKEIVRALETAVSDTGAADAASGPGQAYGLTLREAEIIAMIAAGLTNAEIAQRLFLSVNTVKTYVRTAYRKASVTTRSQAVLWGVDHGFHPVP